MQKSARTPRVSEQTPSQVRGRPRAFDRETALARATRVFWVKGYQATSMADLTEAMGIGAPSLYAAFGSKEALYAEAIRHYRDNYEGLFWTRFYAARTGREAIECLLLDSAAALSGARGDIPNGCMVALSSVGSEGNEQLGELVRAARAGGLDRVKGRLRQAVADGELPASADLHALARFVQTIQVGMSILARDGATRAELEAVAHTSMASWDALIKVRTNTKSTSSRAKKSSQTAARSLSRAHRGAPKK
ncbi:MAG TPA: TetR/AcrR family transcriptional regulator [Steroidobacter sp.]|uniref:TetR/AcrR family transcriptional regulator n=1 Tax=Steroidobacter sp. TaxID=1978227 RepID=UPI002ED8D74A